MNEPAPAVTPRVKRLAQAAFWLFLLKGLAWLVVPALIAAGFWNG